MMKVIGVFLVMLAVALGLYVGFGLLFVPGVVQIIQGANAHPVAGGDVAWGIVKVICASPAGALAFFVVATVGIACYGEGHDSKKRRRRTALHNRTGRL